MPQDDARPDVILWVSSLSDDAQSQVVLENAEWVDALPIDGLVVTHANETFDFMKAGHVTDEAALHDHLAPLGDALKNVEANWLNLHINNPGDLIDDEAGWQQAIENWRGVARAAKDAGFEGLLFDNEEYIPAAQWDDFPEDYSAAEAERGLEAYREAAIRWGREVGAAVAEEWPGGRIAIPFGPAESAREYEGDWFEFFA